MIELTEETLSLSTPTEWFDFVNRFLLSGTESEIVSLRNRLLYDTIDKLEGDDSRNLRRLIAAMPFGEHGVTQGLLEILSSPIVISNITIAAGVVGDFYLGIDKLIKPDLLTELEEEMRKRIGLTEPEYKILFVNGDVGSGKGTTLGILGLKALETGTDGIVGRGDSAYKRWEYLTAPFDLARFKGLYFPNNLMRAFFALEVLSNRIDSNLTKPLSVSGLPRTVEQAEPFVGLVPASVRSMYLSIRPETYVRRVITRMTTALSKGESIRQDDLSSLWFGPIEELDTRFTVADVIPSLLIQAIQSMGENYSEEGVLLFGKIAYILNNNLLSPVPRSRFIRGKSSASDIARVLNERMSVRTTVLETDTKSKEFVAGYAAGYFGLI